MAERKRGRRERVCVGCGKVDSVRADSPSIRCVLCSGRLNASSPRAPPAPSHVCEHCGASFYRAPSQALRRASRYCSMACRRAHPRVDRSCLQCGAGFSLARSLLSGRSNASGNFCCRACYNAFLTRPERAAGRGSRWRSIRAEVLRSFPFCGWCGRGGRLQVHHILPWRLGGSNDRGNLIALCGGCHKRVETATFLAWSAGLSTRELFVVMATLLRQRQLATAAILRRLR